MTQTNLSFVTGRELRDAGMHTAITNAERQITDWPTEAMNALHMYIRAHPGEQFMAEDVREYAYSTLAVPYPPHCPAWGSVIRKASRDGLIAWVRFDSVKTASSHMTPASVWRAA